MLRNGCSVRSDPTDRCDKCTIERIDSYHWQAVAAWIGLKIIFLIVEFQKEPSRLPESRGHNNHLAVQFRSDLVGIIYVLL